MTLFAAMAPFIAMSFLLGGIDFVTILMSLLVVVPVVAVGLGRVPVPVHAAAVAGDVGCRVRAAGFIVIFVFMVSRIPYFLGARRHSAGWRYGSRASAWWALAMVASGSVATMLNLVLLAENRLTAPTVESRDGPADRLPRAVPAHSRVVALVHHAAAAPAGRRDRCVGVIGGLHLALVALFAVTEDLALPRRRFSK